MRSINDQYHTLSGSLRFLNNIVRFPGCGVFDSEASFVALDRKSKSIVGLILCSRVRSDVGHVTQVCVLPEYRGKENWRVAAGRYAKATCGRRNFAALSLTVTEANHKAVALYRRLNFDIEKDFRRVRVGRVARVAESSVLSREQSALSVIFAGSTSPSPPLGLHPGT